MALTNTFPAPKGERSDSLAARKALAGFVVRSAAGVPRAGVFPRHTDPLVKPRADMRVDVDEFEGSLTRRGGAAPIANDGTMAVDIGTKPNSGTRYHVLYLRQNETEFGDASNLPVWGYTMGDTEALADAQVPEGGLIFATVAIPSSATSTQQAIITQRYVYTTTTGGRLTVRTEAELDTLAVLPHGTEVFCLDTGAIAVRYPDRWLFWDTTVQTYAPVLSGPASVGMGTGSYRDGEFVRMGRLCHVRIGLLWGSGGLNMGAGSVRVSLPRPAANRRLGQRIPGQYYYPPIGTIVAQLYIAGSGNEQAVKIVVPDDATANAMSDLNMGTSTTDANRRPRGNNAYGIADNSNALFEGVYEMAA